MIITALIGDPVEHSVSPYMFDMFAKQYDLEYSHLKIKVNKEDKQALYQTLASIRTLNFAGLNITLPYKVEIIKYLDSLDQSAEKIGAVNTVVNEKGKLKGYNTDGIGAVTAINASLGRINKTNKVVILGSGGAARSIIYEISKITKNIAVFNRSIQRLEDLERHFLSNNIPLKTCLLNNTQELIYELTQADYIINTTSVGMIPYTHKTPIPTDIFPQIGTNKKVFDVIFNPWKTDFLLKMENQNNCKVLGGIDMMIYQGLQAFKLWTGLNVNQIDIANIKNNLKSHLK